VRPHPGRLRPVVGPDTLAHVEGRQAVSPFSVSKGYGRWHFHAYFPQFPLFLFLWKHTPHRENREAGRDLVFSQHNPSGKALLGGASNSHPPRSRYNTQLVRYCTADTKILGKTFSRKTWEENTWGALALSGDARPAPKNWSLHAYEESIPPEKKLPRGGLYFFPRTTRSPRGENRNFMLLGRKVW